MSDARPHSDAWDAVRRATRRDVRVWALLMILALATVGSAYVPMGPWNAVANFAIAAIKAGLVAAYFMQLRAGSPVPRLIAGTAIAVGALLFALGGVDYATRRPPAPPPSAPDAVWAAPGAAIPPAAEDRRPAAP